MITYINMRIRKKKIQYIYIYNTAAKCFAPVLRHCSQLIQRAGKLLSYLYWPKSPTQFSILQEYH